MQSASDKTRGNSFAEIGEPWTHALVRRLLCRLEEKSSIPSSDRTRLLQDTAATGCCSAAVQQPDPALWELGIPVLVVCYGMQLLDDPSDLFTNVEDGSTMWMGHGDSVQALPEGFMRLAHKDNTPEVVVADHERRLYGV